jgi:orotidine-5'-phosphate decarboxylase
MRTDAMRTDAMRTDAMRARLVFALDYPNLADAKRAAYSLAESVGVLKVGLELYIAHGAEAVTLGDEVRLPVFLDLKLHDIPATVGRATRRAASLGARYLTVHASGGEAMLRAAVAAAATAPKPLDIVAVTVLTSLDDDDLAAQGITASSETQATRLAELAYGAGVRAFVCSAEEVASLRRALGPEATLITPGIRPEGTASGDQKRVSTPAAAIAAGADLLVVGRAIREADHPAEAARSIVRQMAEA